MHAIEAQLLDQAELSVQVRLHRSSCIVVALVRSPASSLERVECCHQHKSAISAQQHQSAPARNPAATRDRQQYRAHAKKDGNANFAA